MLLTRKQREAVWKVYTRGHEPRETYSMFRRNKVLPSVGSDNYILVNWRGMWLGIEADGYTHS